MLYGTITIRNKQWNISVAADPGELVQGLGGLAGMPAGCGMLFDLGAPQTIQATTVLILFPLDIAFMSETLVITEVYRDIQPGYLVTSTRPARYILEVNAGGLEGIDAGDRASVEVAASVSTMAVPDWASAVVNLIGFVVLGVLMVMVMRDLVKWLFEKPKEQPKLLPQTTRPRSTPSWRPEVEGHYQCTRCRWEGYLTWSEFLSAIKSGCPRCGGTIKQAYNQNEERQRLLPQAKPEGKFLIHMDRMGNIIITHTGRPKQSAFLQFQTDKELVYNVLRKSEKKELDAGWNIEIKDIEPRASILNELWEVSAGTEEKQQDEKLYLTHVGNTASAAAVIPKEKTRSKPGKLEYLADSPEFLTQTIEDIGYRDKIDNTFQEAIARAKGYGQKNSPGGH